MTREPLPPLLARAHRAYDGPDKPSAAEVDQYFKASKQAQEARRRAREGESVIRVRCGKCPKARTLTKLVGDADGVRVWPRSQDGVKGQEGGRVGVFLSQGECEGDELHHVMAADYRVMFQCHPRCGATWPVLRARLEGAFKRAVAQGRTDIYLPRDL